MVSAIPSGKLKECWHLSLCCTVANAISFAMTILVNSSTRAVYSITNTFKHTVLRLGQSTFHIVAMHLYLLGSHTVFKHGFTHTTQVMKFLSNGLTQSKQTFCIIRFQQFRNRLKSYFV
jgi:hypothetical protein